MRALGAVLVGLGGLAVAPFVNLVIDRVPLRRPLRPLDALPRRCPGVELPPLPDYPEDIDEPDEPDEADERDEIDVVLVDEEEDTGDQHEVASPPRLPYENVGGHGAPAIDRPLRRPRCPECGRRCSARYPLVEGLTALLFAATVVRFGADWAVPAYLVLFVCLVAISAVDLDYHIIPNRIVYPTIFAAIPLLLLAALADSDFYSLREAAIGAAGAWTALLVIHLISPRGMGFGDVRLAFILGLFLGWITLPHVITGLFMGFLLGAVIGVALVVVGRQGRGQAIPFGPFLAAGTTLVIFAGGPIIKWWLG